MKGALFLLPPLAAYAILGSVYPALVSQLASFAVFFAAFQLLPALALGQALLRGDYAVSEKAFLGYPPAQAVLFLLVYASGQFQLSWLPLALPALSVIILLLWARSRPSCVALPNSTLWLIMITASLALAVCFTKFLAVAMPTPTTPTEFYHDDIATAAYVWSGVRVLETGLPFSLPFASGFPLSYHLLSIYNYSYAFKLIGALPLEQVLYYWPPLHWGMLAGGVVVACRRFAMFSVQETAVAILLLFFCAGYGFFASPGLQLFMYFHTYFYGLPALILLLALLYCYLGGRRDHIDVAYASLLFLVVAGTKANLLLFIPLSLLPVLLYRIATRKVRRADFALVAAMLAVVPVLLACLYQYPGSTMVSFGNIKYGKLFMGALGCLTDMMIVVGPFLLVAVLAADANPVIRHKLAQDRQYHIFFFAFVLSSSVFLKLVNYVGGDFYFYWQAGVIAALGFVGVATHALKWRTKHCTVLVVLLLALGLGTFVRKQYFSPGGNWQPQNASAKNIDAAEVEGLRWASEHLDRKKTFFTNKYFFLGSYLGQYLPVDMPDYLGLAGLQGYAFPIDALGYIKKETDRRVALMQRFWEANAPEEQDAALSQLGADYYFHCERLAPGNYSGLRNLREVYRNPSLTIYELNPKAAEAPAQAGQ